jgi:hypothetical protein
MTKRHAKPTSAQLVARIYRKLVAMDSLLTDTIDANGEALDAINSKLGVLMERVSSLNPIVDHCARLLKEKETLQRQVERMQALAPKQSIAAQDQSPFEPFEYNSASSLARMEMSHKVIDIMQPPIPTLNFEMRQYPCGCSATGNGVQPLPDCCPNHYDAPYNNMNSSFEGSPGDGMPKFACTLAHLHRAGIRCEVCGEMPA